MKIAVAEFYNNEGFLQTTDSYELPAETDTETILDFIEFTKRQMGHDVIKRNKVNMLFSDGIRVVLRQDDLIRMADLKEYITIVTKVETTVTEVALEGNENDGK